MSGAGKRYESACVCVCKCVICTSECKSDCPHLWPDVERRELYDEFALVIEWMFVFVCVVCLCLYI